MTLENPSCDDLASPSYANFSLSMYLSTLLPEISFPSESEANFIPSFILVGILVSYIPQHHRIISRRTSEGISPYFVLLGTTSSTFAFANILTLPASRDSLACCSEVSGFDCFAGLLGIAQVGIQWICFTVMFVVVHHSTGIVAANSPQFSLLLFLLFFPRASPFKPSNSLSASPPPTYRTALLVTAICITHAVFIFVISNVILFRAPNHLQAWANFLGIFATILAAVQFIPQIFTTWRLQAVGSLSIPTMCIQTPGSFVFAGSLAKRLGPSGWSSWGIYLVTGCLQGGLLGMSILFELKERERRKQGDGIFGNGHEGQNGQVEEDDDDTTTLLGNER